ncbi:MAG: RDD family protein [Bacilli bacterium]|nr:RDD family protein [Bacilli bacterium]
MSKDEKDEKSDKPLFITRSIAFLFDMFLVLLLSSVLATPFVNSDKITSLAKDSQTLLEKYNKKEVTEQEYMVEMSNLEYQVATSTELVSLFGVFVGLIYFVIVPLYNKGQTLGKKIMKIRIVSTYKDLNSNQLVFRSFIANAILLKFVSVLLLMFASRDVYTSCVESLTVTQYLIMAVSMVMVIVNKNGMSLHDGVVHTKVVKVK